MSHLILYVFSLFFTSVVPTRVPRIPLTGKLKADKPARRCSSLFQDVSSDDDVSESGEAEHIQYMNVDRQRMCSFVDGFESCQNASLSFTSAYLSRRVCVRATN